MTESLRIVLEETSQTAEARRAARRMSKQIGFDETLAEQVAIVVTEACTNLLKHGGGGEVLLQTTGDHSREQPKLELMALDRGPGMNLEQCTQDGFTTGTSPGHGLGAIMRLSSTCDFYSLPRKGTVVLARWAVPETKPENEEQPLRFGAVHVCKRGQEISGDSWGLEQINGYSVIMMADGLGHGYEAHVASSEAIRIFHLHAELPPKALIERTHQALRSGRGAAVAVAKIDRHTGTLTFSGAGNISAQIYSPAKPCQHLVSVNGTAGHQTQTLREFSYPWPADGVLVMHSDGLSRGTGLESYPRLPARDASLIAGVLYRDFSRGHDDATVVVAKAA
ncbi:MAG TPA: SpoIIE family protein phosphatase [Bryobacteraceae bacterium]|nr:SpoIIE family protein phosphatase [Bryobacteraceae bacterium]